MKPLIEISEGVLATENKALVKVWNFELLPLEIQEYFSKKEKIKKCYTAYGVRRITVFGKEKTSVYDLDFYNYIKDLEDVCMYLSCVPLPNESVPLYPLVAKYKYGVCVLAPLDAEA